MYGQTFNIFQSALASAETRNNMTQFGLWRLIHSKRLIFPQLLICECLFGPAFLLISLHVVICVLHLFGQTSEWMNEWMSEWILNSSYCAFVLYAYSFGE